MFGPQEGGIYNKSGIQPDHRTDGHAVPVVRQILFLPGTRGMCDDRGFRSFPRPY